MARRREVVAPLVPPALAPRDPRFDDAVKGVYDEKVFKKNYSFLEGYKEDEMKLLKQEMAKTKDERKKEQLKKTIVSMVWLETYSAVDGLIMISAIDPILRAATNKQTAIKKAAAGAQRADRGAGAGS